VEVQIAEHGNSYFRGFLVPEIFVKMIRFRVGKARSMCEVNMMSLIFFREQCVNQRVFKLIGRFMLEEHQQKDFL
jgi:hypothetical protein